MIYKTLENRQRCINESLKTAPLMNHSAATMLKEAFLLEMPAMVQELL